MKPLLLTISTALVSVSLSALAAEPLGADEVVVTGSRVSDAAVAIGTDQTTATVGITREALLSAPAGITGLKVLESLPGFNVQANDALGMYEFGNSVSVRAFTFRQIGFIVDGIPLGRSDQFGGSPIYRYVDNENLQRVSASAGSGDVSLPSYASLGPIVSYTTIAPSTEASLAASQTFGSDALRRTFARLQAGEHAGWSGYVSASIIDGDLWRGSGTIDRDHYEAKLRYGFGDTSVTFKAVRNDYFDFDSPAITLAQYNGTANDPFGRIGREFAYLDYVPALPQTSAGIVYSNPSYNQYFRQAINSRTDDLFGLTLDAPLGDRFDLTATAYYEDKEGYGVSPEAYSTSLSSYNAQRLILLGLFAPRGLQYGLSTVAGNRKGLTASLAGDFGMNDVTLTAWFERDQFHRTQARYNQTAGNPAGEPLLNEPVHRQRDFVSRRDSLQVSLKDVIHLLDDRLKVEIGAKALDIDYDITGYRNPADYINRRQPRIEANWSDSFLPQIGGVWQVTARDQLFTSYSENLALPQGADDIFALASPATPAPDAERAKNWEIGVRSNRATFNASLVAYYTRFENRLQSFAAPVPGSTTTETFFQNVGGVEARGLELSGQWKPELFDGRVYFSTNASYNRARFEDSYSTLAIAGKALPDFPERVVQAGVTLEPIASTLVNFSARYIDSRYSNFTNNEQVGGYAVLNGYVEFGEGLHFGPLEEVRLRVNVDNIFDRDYLGTITTTTNTAATFRPASPRTVQVTLSAHL
ncbi:MAG: TonB-dependent receptor [Steroidobacteraceae bacterium]